MIQVNLKELYSIAAQHYLAGHHDKAAATYRRILKIEPDRADVLHLLAKVEFSRRRFDDALDLFDRCLEMASVDDARLQTATHRMRGETLRSMGRFSDALVACQEALALDPGNTTALISLGAVLRSLGRLDDALACLDCVIQLEPDLAPAYNNRGNVLRELGRSADAIADYRRALAINPRQIDAHNNLANELRNLGNLEDSIASYEHALSMRPDDPVFLVNLFNVLSYACAWERRKWVTSRLDKATDVQLERGGRVVETPFIYSLRGDDPGVLRDIGVSAATASVLRAPSCRSERNAVSKSAGSLDSLRVGYLIDGLDNQPARRKLQTLAQNHDRDRFTVFAYCSGSELNRQEHLARICDGYASLKDLDDVEAADRIAADRLDVLVDLAGHQPGSRLGILAQHVAPVQLIWPNLTVTTGSACADYFVTDNVTVPPKSSGDFDETLLYLPAGHQALAHESLPVPEQPSRDTLGLPSDAIVFACFGRALRFDPIMFATWMQILKVVPNSVLWLGRTNRLTVDNLRSAARDAGIDPERLIFAGRARTRTAHLARLQCADVWLDTQFQCSEMAMLDALWAGVPAITLRGKTAPARGGASILRAAGLAECIADDMAGYAALARDLAEHREKRESITKRLNAGRDVGALFDKAVVISRFEEMLYRVAGSEPRMSILQTSLPAHAGVAGAAL